MEAAEALRTSYQEAAEAAVEPQQHPEEAEAEEVGEEYLLHPAAAVEGEGEEVVYQLHHLAAAAEAEGVVVEQQPRPCRMFRLQYRPCPARQRLRARAL